jgi:tetratricopeptide (TPR) repeat protein
MHKISRSLKPAGWLACLICVVILIIGGVKPTLQAFSQAVGVRQLMRFAGGLPEDMLANPFVCLREGETGGPVEGIGLSDYYLQAVGLCLTGDQGAGLNALEQAGKASGAVIQYAAGISAIDTLAGVSLLRNEGVRGRELVAVVQKLVSQPGVDPFPLIRLVAEKAPEQILTWSLWLQGSSLLEANGDWQAALDWIDEGLTKAPGNVRSSLLLRMGRIYQTRVEPRDYQSASQYYRQAIQVDAWIYPIEEGSAHLYLGEIYRNMKDMYSPEQALGEFNAVLRILPGNYSALLDIGHLYLNDLKDLSAAEYYYKQALASNDQSPYAYLYLGDVFRERGDIQAASEWYQQALEHQPGWQAVLNRIKDMEGK